MNRNHLAALAAGLLLTGAAMPALGQADSTIRVRLESDIRSTNPGVNRDAATDYVMLHTVEGLVAYREDASVGLLLADSMDVSEDGTTYTFTLRDGVTFHNGEPLTADDVVWSWQRYLDPATEWRCLSAFDGSDGFAIDSVTALDADTVVFTVNAPSSLFLVAMARTDCGMSGILHPDSVNADGSWNSPIGTGPFMLGEWEPDQSITLEKFDDYAALEGPTDGYTGGKMPLVEAVEFVVIPDPTSAKAALLAGDIDVIPDLDHAAFDEIAATPGFETAMSGTTGRSGILLQTTDPILGNPLIRQAIAHALDWDQMVDAITEGHAEPNGSMVPTTSAYYSEIQTERPAYDPDLTAQLLDEAGYDGEEIVLLTNQNYTSMYDTAVYAQALLQQAGLNVRLEVLEWGAQLDLYSSGDYQMMAFAYSARLDPALSYDSVLGVKSEQPNKVWDNPEARSLLEEAEVVSDTDRRQEIFDQLHELFLADLPMIMLYNGAALAGFSENVEGFAPWPAATPRLFGVALAE